MTQDDLRSLDNASIAELFRIKAQLSRYIDGRLEAQKQDALDQIKKTAVEYKLTYEEVLAVIRTSTRRGKAPPLYRNPERPRQTWSGKGDAPDWFKNHPDPERLLIP